MAPTPTPTATRDPVPHGFPQGTFPQEEGAVGLGPYITPDGYSQVIPGGRKKKYRVMFGTHIEPVDGEKMHLEAGTGYRVYRKGDVFETTRDYDRWDTKLRNVSQEGVAANAEVWDSNRETLEQFCLRMQRAGKVGLGPATPLQQDNPPVVPAAVAPPDGSNEGTYAGMTEDELRRFAQSEGINLRGCRSRDDVLRAIQSHESKR